MTDKSKNWIAFVAEYEDKTRDFFQVDTFSLDGGDEAGLIVARQRQESGKLRPGKITRVHRL